MIVDKLPPLIRKALLGHEIVFILRGWPGLGRVMQGVSFSQIIKKVNPKQHQVFYSSERGLTFLKELNYEVSDIATGADPNPLLGGLDRDEVYLLIETIETDPPFAIIIDGELQLMSVLRSIYTGPIIALANSSDLFNPKQSKGNRLLFRSYYHSCDFVIIGSFNPINIERLPSSFPKILWVPPLVREEIYYSVNDLSDISAHDIVVVLGGGAHGAMSLKSINKQIVDSVYKIASRNPKRHFTFFGIDSLNGRRKRAGNISLGSVEHCSSAIASCKLVIARAGRNVISEILELKKQAILIPSITTGKKSDIHRAVEQQKNADLSSKLSSGIRLWDGRCTEELQTLIEMADAAKPIIVHWNSGNKILEKLLKK